MNKIESIKSFGSEDAENDENLSRFFYEAFIMESLLKGDKSLVLGRKGTGKTAIYKYVKAKYIETVSPMTFSEYPWNYHELYKNDQLSDREQYKQSWLLFFYIEFFKLICKNANKFDEDTSKEIKNLQKWLKKNYGSIDFTFKETLSPKSPKWILNFNPQVMGCGLGSISKEIQKSNNMNTTLSKFINNFECVLKKFSEKTDKSFYLLFDELDISYSSNDKNYENRLVGLLLANYTFKNLNFKSFSTIVFLRNDIFQQIEFQDKRKIKDGVSINLDWAADSVNDPLSLKQMACKRIKEVCKTGTDNFERNWNEVFEPSTIYKNQNKWSYFTDRSFYRPRDLIKIMNLSLKAAHQRLKVNPDSLDFIINDDIRSIQKEYSIYLYDEIKDETHVKYPNFDKYLEILRSIHTISFTQEMYEINYKSIKQRYPDIDSKEDILRILYEYGIIGFYKPGGGGAGGSEYCYIYKSFQPFNPRAERFKIHMGFKEYLELIEEKKSGK